VRVIPSHDRPVSVNALHRELERRCVERIDAGSRERAARPDVRGDPPQHTVVSSLAVARVRPSALSASFWIASR